MEGEEAGNRGIRNGRNRVLSESSVDEGILQKDERRREARNPVLNERNRGDLLGLERESARYREIRGRGKQVLTARYIKEDMFDN